MKSKNEEYLDELLKSVTHKNVDHNSIGSSNENHAMKSESRNLENIIKDADNFSNDENEDFRAINEMLAQADNNEIIDDSLVQILDSLSADDGIAAPKIKVGADPVLFDTRDEEERKLDEAIANAEQFFSEKPVSTDAYVEQKESEEKKDSSIENVMTDVSEEVKDIDKEFLQEDKTEWMLSDAKENVLDNILLDQLGTNEYSKDNVPEDRKIPDGEIERHDIQESEEDTEDDKSLGLSFVSDESENILNGSDINLDDMLEQMDSFIEQSESENQYIKEMEEKSAGRNVLSKRDESEKLQSIQPQEEKHTTYDSDEKVEESLDENFNSDNSDSIPEIERKDFDLEKKENIEVEDIGNTGNAGNTGNTGNAGNAGNAGNTGNIGDIGNAEEVQGADTIDNTTRIESSEETEKVGRSDNTENIENVKQNEDRINTIEKTEETDNIEKNDNVKETDRKEKTVNIEDTLNAENTENIENTGDTENTENTGDTENIGNIENARNTADIKKTNSTENINNIEKKDGAEEIDNSKENDNQGLKSEETDIAELDALMNSLSEDNVGQLDDRKNEKTDASEETEDDLFNGLTEDEAEENSAEKGLEEENPEIGSDEDSLEGQSLEEALAEHIDVAENADENIETDSETEKGHNKTGRKKRSKTTGPSGEKKEGFFVKVFHSLFESLEPEEETTFAESNELASLSAENQQILDELEKEKKAEGSEGKEKKEKVKKEKKVKEKKPPKPKKEKKEKPKKEPKVPNPEDLKPLKKISPKKIIISFVFAITFGVFLMLPSIVLPERTVVSEAEASYAQGDYLTAYKNLYGKTNLSEMDRAIYEKARAIARMQHFYKSYVTYTSMKKPVEALNSLLKGVSLYPEILKEAQATGDNVVENEVNKAYDNIKSALMQTYGISPDQSEKILALQDDTEYTIRLHEIAGVR